MIIDTQQWITGKQAYDRLGMSKQSFYRAASTWHWRSTVVFGVKVYSRADINAYKPIVGHPTATLARTIPQSDDISYEDDTTMP